MSYEIRRKPEMTKANTYNDKKLLSCVIIYLLFNFAYKKNFKIQKKN